MTHPNTITIDSIEYVRKDSQPTGERAIVIVAHGFIHAGAIRQDDEGNIEMRDAVNVRKWSNGGLGGLTQGAKSSDATLDPIADLTIRSSCVVQVIPIGEDWDVA